MLPALPLFLEERIHKSLAANHPSASFGIDLKHLLSSEQRTTKETDFFSAQMKPRSRIAHVEKFIFSPLNVAE